MDLNRRLADWNRRMLGLPHKMALVLAALFCFWLALHLLPYGWPFAAAFVFSRILEPFVRAASKGLLRLRFSRRHSRALATAACMILLFGMTGTLAYALIGWLFRELSSFLSSLPQYLADLAPELMNLCRHWQTFLPAEWSLLGEAFIRSLGQNAIRWAGALSAWLTSGVWNTAASIPHAFFSVIMLLMGTYYLTADRAQIAAFFHYSCPPQLIRRIRLIRASMLEALIGQLRGQLTVSLMVLFFLTLTLGVSSVNHGALIGLLIGIADGLPVLGAGLFLIPWSLFSFLTGAPGMGVTLACLYAGTIVIRQILEPRIVGRELGVYPLAAMSAMYAGFRIMGPAGLLCGPLLLTAVKAVLAADQAVTKAPLSARR